MAKLSTQEEQDFALSVKLQFPKFSKGYDDEFFKKFIDDNVGKDNLAAIGRLAFPNEWQIKVKNPEIREKLIRIGRTKIKSRTCWIYPLNPHEVRGYVHWIPNAVSENTICGYLEPYGDVMFMEVEMAASQQWTKVDCSSRYFALRLKPGQTVNDIPHFVKISDHHGLITIKGRAPCCFHCRTVGHRKKECQKYRDKLKSYCLRDPNSAAKRVKPRGRRHDPNTTEIKNSKSVKSKNRKRGKRSKSDRAQVEKGFNEAGSSTAVENNAGLIQQSITELEPQLKAMANTYDLSTMSQLLSIMSQNVKHLHNQIQVVSNPENVSQASNRQQSSNDIGNLENPSVTKKPGDVQQAAGSTSSNVQQAASSASSNVPQAASSASSKVQQAGNALNVEQKLQESHVQEASVDTVKVVEDVIKSEVQVEEKKGRKKKKPKKKKKNAAANPNVIVPLQDADGNPNVTVPSQDEDGNPSITVPLHD